MATGSGEKNRVSRFGEDDDAAQSILLRKIEFDVLLTFSNVGGVVEFAAAPIAGLPRGDLIIVGGFLHVDFFEKTAQANILDTFVISYALGTIATVNNSLADATDFNIKTAVTLAAATAGVAPHSSGILNGVSTLADRVVVAGNAYLDNNNGLSGVFLNATLPDASALGGSPGNQLRAKGLLRIATIGLGRNS